MKHRFLIILTVLLFPYHINAQKISNDDIIADTTDQIDLIDIAKDNFRFSPKKIKRNSKKKIYFSLLPTSSTVPGAGKVLITSTKAGFYLGNRKRTNLSEVNFSPYTNFKGRYAVTFASNLYTNKNLWNIQGETRFSFFPEYVYGNKQNNTANERLLINYKYVRFYQTVLKQIRPYILTGIGYNLDYHIDIKTAAPDSLPLDKFSRYEHGTAPNSNSFSSGLTLNLLYDSRYNSINPLPGAYINLIYRLNPSFLGNTKPWKSIYLDVRKYKALEGQSRRLLAFWSYLWMALDNNVPYLDLPSIGAEPNQKSGRGIEINRYRGKNLFYLEGEYRSDITQNGLLGYVVFANLNMNSGPADNALSLPHPAIGTGLRVKFNKRSNTNIAVDFGLSSNYSIFTLRLGEAF